MSGTAVRLPNEAERLANAVLIIPCSHGWQSTHCMLDNEGSHPGSLTPSDDCYCGEAEYIDGIENIRWRLAEANVREAEAKVRVTQQEIVAAKESLRAKGIWV